jgi:hypothetical protein
MIGPGKNVGQAKPVRVFLKCGTIFQLLRAIVNLFFQINGPFIHRLETNTRERAIAKPSSLIAGNERCSKARINSGGCGPGERRSDSACKLEGDVDENGKLVLF